LILSTSVHSVIRLATPQRKGEPELSLCSVVVILFRSRYAYGLDPDGHPVQAGGYAILFPKLAQWNFMGHIDDKRQFVLVGLVLIAVTDSDPDDVGLLKKPRLVFLSDLSKPSHLLLGVFHS